MSYASDESLRRVLFPDTPEDALPLFTIDTDHVGILRIAFANKEFYEKYWKNTSWQTVTRDARNVIPFVTTHRSSLLGVELLFGYEVNGTPREQWLEYIKVFGDTSLMPATDEELRDEAFHDFFSTIFSLRSQDRQEHKVWSFTEFLRGLKEPVGNTVLLLGSYRQQSVYEHLAQSLQAFGYDTFMLKDSMDLAVQTNMEKLFAGILCSCFVVMLDDEPSGHIAELQTLLNLRFRPVIVIRQEGHPATHFLEDTVATNDMFKIHLGQDLSPRALAESVAWARTMMKQRVAHLNEINAWRSKGVL